MTNIDTKKLLEDMRPVEAVSDEHISAVALSIWMEHQRKTERLRFWVVSLFWVAVVVAALLFLR